MQLAHIAFPTPAFDFSPQSYLDLTSQFPRIKFTLSVSDLSNAPERLSSLVVAHAAVSAARGLDSSLPDFTLVLSDAALAEFLLEGSSKALDYVLTHTSRPEIYDALVLDFPVEQLPFDPNKFLKALPDLSFPVIFKLTPANAPLFDVAIGYAEIMAIPLHLVNTAHGDISFPQPYPELPNGYQLDLSKVMPKEWALYLAHFKNTLPASALIWFDWIWTAPEPSDYISLLRSYYQLASAHFDQTV